MSSQFLNLFRFALHISFYFRVASHVCLCLLFCELIIKVASGCWVVLAPWTVCAYLYPAYSWLQCEKRQPLVLYKHFAACSASHGQLGGLETCYDQLEVLLQKTLSRPIWIFIIYKCKSATFRNCSFLWPLYACILYSCWRICFCLPRCNIWIKR